MAKRPGQMDLVVLNGTLVTERGQVHGAVCVRGGRIAGICSNERAPAASQIVDATGLYVLPGLIEGHVHFREPGMTYKEDFESGSRSAAAGGVTTVIDMPNGTHPPLQSVVGFREKLRLVAGRSYVDYGFIAAVVPRNLEEIKLLASAGILGFKVFMGETVGAIEIPDDGTMLDAYALVARSRRPLLTHAENDEIIQHLVKRLKAKGRQGIRAHLDSRPVVAEEEAIARAVLFAKATGARLHVLHVSSREGIAVIRRAKREGVRVTAETCPHYLLMTTDEIDLIGNPLRMNPPVRGGEHPEALWRAIKDGTVDVIGTDHSSHATEEKLKESIWETVPGWTGVETTTALMLTEVNRGRLTLEELVRLRSLMPAKIFGLYPRKGSLNVGADADLTLVDMEKESVVAGKALKSRSKYTPFEGRALRGMPVMTVVRGEVVMRNGEIVGRPVGEYLKPGPSLPWCFRDGS